MHDILEDAVMERTVWAAMKSDHALRAMHRPDAELAETFFNSVTRRVFSTVGVDPAIEYLELSVPHQPGAGDSDIHTSQTVPAINADLIRQLLLTFPWSVPYAQLERDSALVAELIVDELPALGSSGPATRSVAVGVLPEQRRLPRRANRAADETIPLVLPLLHAERGIVVDAVLMTSDEASVVFGFSWTYFRVDLPSPPSPGGFSGIDHAAQAGE